MRSLLLVAHAPTAATRAARFPDDEPIEGDPVAALPHAARALTSPSLAARQTAEGLKLEATVAAELADLDHGSWRGRTIDDVQTSDPDGFARWMEDPAARPHGGETIAGLVARVGGLLDRVRELDGATIAVTHQAPVRAAVLHALGAPLDAFWRIDAAPLSITELHPHRNGWRLACANWRAR